MPPRQEVSPNRKVTNYVELSKYFNVHKNTIRKWVKEYEKGNDEASDYKLNFRDTFEVFDLILWIYKIKFHSIWKYD